MLLDPAEWLVRLMELTELSGDFKVVMVILAVATLVGSWCLEQYIFVYLVRALKLVQKHLAPKNQKARKRYKVIDESMRF